MKAKLTITQVLVATAVAGLTGCAGTSPVATGGQAAAPDRHVTAVDGSVSDPQMEQVISQLPQRISAEDAKGLLVQIDPQQIGDAKDGGYEVAARGWRGGRGGHFRGFAGSRFGSYYNRFSYYPFGSYYFPYTYYGGYYYPYFNNSYYPYLYNTASMYYPYYYYNSLYSYSNPFYRARSWYWPGIL